MFAPCNYKNHKFVDGGILDNIPAEEVKKLGVDKVLTIKFSPGLDYAPKNIFEVALKSIDIVFEVTAEESIKKSDFVLDLDLAEASVFNTKKIDYCYNVGYTTTLAKIKEIKKMINDK